MNDIRRIIAFPDGRLVPEIRGGAMVNPSLSQVAFRGRYFSGTESGAGWHAAENTGWNQGQGTRFRVRFEVAETAGAAENVAVKLQYNLNGAGWVDVTTTSAVIRAISGGLGSPADGANTTDQLTTAATAFVAGEYSEDGVANTVLPSINNSHTEFEFSLQLIDADVAPTDSVQLRLVRSSGTILEAYAQIPTITVVEPSFLQTSWRGRNDDGDEINATWKAAQEVGWFQEVDIGFRVRLVYEDDGGEGTTILNSLQYRINGGPWTTDAGVIAAFDSPNVATNDPTTDQLTGSSKEFIAGFISEVGVVATGSFVHPANRHTEHEFSIQIVGSGVSNQDLIELAISARTPEAGDTFPQITAIVPVDETLKQVTPLVQTTGADAALRDDVGKQVPVLVQTSASDTKVFTETGKSVTVLVQTTQSDTLVEGEPIKRAVGGFKVIPEPQLLEHTHDVVVQVSLDIALHSQTTFLSNFQPAVEIVDETEKIEKIARRIEKTAIVPKPSPVSFTTLSELPLAIMAVAKTHVSRQMAVSAGIGLAFSGICEEIIGVEEELLLEEELVLGLRSAGLFRE